MAVMQTPHGRVIGLILHTEDQPKPEPVKEAETPKPVTARKPGRPAKK